MLHHKKNIPFYSFLEVFGLWSEFQQRLPGKSQMAWCVEKYVSERSVLFKSPERYEFLSEVKTDMGV